MHSAINSVASAASLAHPTHHHVPSAQHVPACVPTEAIGIQTYSQSRGQSHLLCTYATHVTSHALFPDATNGTAAASACCAGVLSMLWFHAGGPGACIAAERAEGSQGRQVSCVTCRHAVLVQHSAESCSAPHGHLPHHMVTCAPVLVGHLPPCSAS